MAHRKQKEYGIAGKTPVFRLLKKWKSVHVGCSELLERIGNVHFQAVSTAHTEGREAYDGTILNGYNYYRIFHNENKFAHGKFHVNDTECL